MDGSHTPTRFSDSAVARCIIFLLKILGWKVHHGSPSTDAAAGIMRPFCQSPLPYDFIWKIKSFGVKDCFCQLEHHMVLASLDRLLDSFQSKVRNPKLSAPWKRTHADASGNKFSAKWGVPSDSGYATLRFDEIKYLVKHRLNNFFVRFGKNVALKQCKGMPMGSAMGAALCSLTLALARLLFASAIAPRPPLL